MILLHQFPPAFGLPSASPFCLKLQCFFRMAKIPYRTTQRVKMSLAPKGKFPFIQEGDQLLADSGLIIEELTRRLNNPLGETPEQQQDPAAHAMRRMLEDHFYFALLYSRWIEEDNFRLTAQEFFAFLPAPARLVVPHLVRRKVSRDLKGQGLGRHQAQEIYQAGCQDLKALSDYLGDKPYLQGDHPTRLDATAYGFLASLFWMPFQSPLKNFGQELGNLELYCHRVVKDHW